MTGKIIFLLKIISTPNSYCGPEYVDPVQADDMEELRDYIKDIFETQYRLKFIGMSSLPTCESTMIEYIGLIDDLYDNDWFFDKYLKHTDIRLFECHLEDKEEDIKGSKNIKTELTTTEDTPEIIDTKSITIEDTPEIINE